jgi:hypothetical protein
MYSINTYLLQVFSTLIVHERSFSAGDLTFVDTDGKLFASLIERGATLFGFDYHEYVLPVPLEVLCKCDWCLKHSKHKRAIRFRQIDGKYLFIRLLEYPGASFNGLMNQLKLNFFSEESECAIRTSDRVPYNMHTRDRETIKRVVDSQHLPESLALFEDYNAKTRIGNEFFVPPAMLLNTRLYN